MLVPIAPQAVLSSLIHIWVKQLPENWINEQKYLHEQIQAAARKPHVADFDSFHVLNMHIRLTWAV